jgi:hypothetical protein
MHLLAYSPVVRRPDRIYEAIAAELCHGSEMNQIADLAQLTTMLSLHLAGYRSTPGALTVYQHHSLRREA